MSYIFICYSKHNKDYAYATANYLQEKGFNIWIDRADIEYGVDWFDAIVEGLNGCGAALVIMTPEAKASHWVNLEVHIALNKGKQILPLLLNGDNWELFITTQYADVHDGSMPNDKFLKRLSRLVTPQRQTGDDKSPVKLGEQVVEADVSQFSITGAVADFRHEYERKNWSQALEVLGRIRASGEKLTDFSLDDYERRIRSERTAAIIGEPFEWLIIPDGSVSLENTSDYSPPGTVGGVFAVPTFIIAKYPVTVAQYEHFIRDNGYGREVYWTPSGWTWKQYENINEPNNWGNTQLNKATYPVVGVSWYEAIAYCRWLSEKSGQNISLPTEQQWQRAAQGDTQNKYPWGPEFDPNLCNFNAQNPASVTEYPDGSSPYGAMNMSGNAWEWCATEWGKENIVLDSDQLRSLRGGSWSDQISIFVQATFRRGANPSNRENNRGFRCIAGSA